MKTIIVATDFSNAGQNALEYGASLAKHLKTRLVIFNAFHIRVSTSYIPDHLPDIEDLIKENGERLAKLSAEVSNSYQIETESFSCHGFAVDELRKVVRKKEADLIVMGMTGEQNFSKKLFGSLTTAVIQEGYAHVLVVPENAVFSPLKSILFACDDDPLKSKVALNVLKEFAVAFEASIQVFQVVDEKEFSLSTEEEVARMSLFDLEGNFKGVKHSYNFVKGDDVLRGIEKGIEDHKSDLLVMAPHKEDFWDKFLNRSSTRKMALRTHIPLLSLQENFVSDSLEAQT